MAARRHRRVTSAWTLVLLLAALPARAWADDDRVRLERTGCVPEGWDDAVFANAVAAELSMRDVTLDDAAAVTVTAELACTSPVTARIRVVLPRRRPVAREISLEDVEPTARPRALALAVHDLYGEALLVPPDSPPPIDEGEGATLPDPSSARDRDRRRVALEIGGALALMTQRPTPTAGPIVGVEVPADDLPLSLVVRVGFVYGAVGQGGASAEAMALDVRVGGRAWLALPPVRLGVEILAAGGWAGLSGRPREGAPVRLDTATFSIDAHLRASIDIDDRIGLGLALGARSFVVGAQATIAGAPAVGFVEVLPSASLELTIGL